MRIGSRCSSLSLALFIGACTPGEPQGPVAVADSAGIRILEYAGRPPLDTLGGLAVVDLGTIDHAGPEQFDRIAGMALLHDASLAVADQGSGEIRIFSRDEAAPRVMGGKGDGPGEFRTLARVVALPPDSVLGFDTRGSRFAIFSKEGTLGRTGQLQRPEVGGVPRFEGLLAGGLWLCSVRLPTSFDSEDSESGRSFQDGVLLFRYSPDGSPLDSIGRSSSVEMVRERQGTAVTTQLVPLGSQGYWGTTGGGAFVASSTRSEVRFVVALPQAWVRWVPEMRDLTEQEWEEALEGEIADSDPSRAPVLRERYARMPRPRWSPLYDRVVGSEAGGVWLREVDSGQWLVVDDQAQLRRVIVPDGFTPMLITETEVFGVWIDEFGVEHVRGYGSPKGLDRDVR